MTQAQAVQWAAGCDFWADPFGSIQEIRRIEAREASMREYRQRRAAQITGMLMARPVPDCWRTPEPSKLWSIAWKLAAALAYVAGVWAFARGV